MISIVIQLSPYAAFALAHVVSHQGIDILPSLENKQEILNDITILLYS